MNPPAITIDTARTVRQSRAIPPYVQTACRELVRLQHERAVLDRLDAHLRRLVGTAARQELRFEGCGIQYHAGKQFCALRVDALRTELWRRGHGDDAIAAIIAASSPLQRRAPFVAVNLGKRVKARIEQSATAALSRWPLPGQQTRPPVSVPACPSVPYPPPPPIPPSRPPAPPTCSPSPPTASPQAYAPPPPPLPCLVALPPPPPVMFRNADGRDCWNGTTARPDEVPRLSRTAAVNIRLARLAPGSE